VAKSQKRGYKSRQVVFVDDSWESLKIVGSVARKEIDGKFIGITGSAGKTTTKEMAHALLNGSFIASKTTGNLNNLYGLPLCLGNIEGHEEVFVGEMGMSYPGELKALTNLVDPDIGVLLNVHPVHTVNFGGVEEVAQAKAELFEAMRDNTTIIYNNDNRLSSEIGEKAKKRKLTFGILQDSDLMAENIRYRGFDRTDITLAVGNERHEISIPRFGLANVYNFLAAAAIAYAMGVDAAEYERRIIKMAVAVGRGNVYRLGKDITLLDDSYNSNPVAMEMLLGFIDRYRNDGRKVVIAGDMLELGSQGSEAHNKIGKLIAKSNIDLLVTVGELSRKMMEGALKEGMRKASLKHFDSAKEAAARISDLIKEHDLVLVKGSNSIRTDLVVKKLKATFK